MSGRIDRLAIDLRRQWLFVAELDNDSVGVIDAANRKLISTMRGFQEPQGIAYEPFDRHALRRKCGGRVGTPYARR